MKQELPKQIKIIKSSRNTLWYSRSNCIGKIFEVTGIWNKNYIVDYENEKDLYIVRFGDCEIVNQGDE